MLRLAAGHNDDIRVWARARQHPREGVFYGSMVTGRPAAVCQSAVTVDQLGVGVAAAGE